MTSGAIFPNMAVCASCASPTRPGEKFCATCGALITAPSVAAVPMIAPVPAPFDEFVSHPSTVAGNAHPGAASVARRGPTRLTVMLVAAALVVASTVGVLVANDMGTHGKLAVNRRTLASTQAELAATSGRLTSTKSQLASTQASWARTKTNLASTTAAKAHLQSQLTSTQAQLAGVRGNLSQTQNQLNLQAGQLEIVKTCLSGFATALNADLNGDYSSGLAALQSVQSACDEASKLFH